METTRRSVLKASGVAAVLGVTSLSGCSGILGGGSGGGNYQYDPATLVETQNRFFGSADYAALYAARDQFPQSTQESFESAENSPVNPEDIETMTGVGGAQVSMSGSGGGTFFGSFGVLGSFDKSTAEEGIQSEGNAEQTGEYEGFTLYETTGETSAGGFDNDLPSDGTATAAVGDGALLIGVASTQGEGEASVTGEQAARKMIDAGNGNAESLVDNSDYASELDNRLGDSTVQFGGEVDPGLVEMATQGGGSGMQSQLINGIRAGGFGMAIDGATTTMTAVGLYESAEAASNSGIEDMVGFASQNAEQQEGINSIDANTDGNAVIVTLEGDTQTIFEQGATAGPGGGFSVTRPDSAASVMTRTRQ